MRKAHKKFYEAIRMRKDFFRLAFKFASKNFWHEFRYNESRHNESKNEKDSLKIDSLDATDH